MTKYLFADTETGGQNPLTDALLTVGLVAELDGVVLGTLHLKILPSGLECKGPAMLVNKIDLVEHCKEAISREDAALAIKRFVRLHFGFPRMDNKPVPVGQNVQFDLGFLYKLFADFEMDEPFRTLPLDTMHITFLMLDLGLIEVKNAKLDTLMTHFGIEIPEEERHTALGDALATRQVFHALKGSISKHLIPVAEISNHMGCHCDLEPGEEPDECYIDTGNPEDCSIAAQGGVKCKTDCAYWKPFTKLTEHAAIPTTTFSTK